MSAGDPVLEAAALALTPGDGNGEPLVIDPARLPAVERTLRACYGDDALPDVVEELCLFACWVGSAHHSPTARDALLRVAEGSIDALHALGDKAEGMARELGAAKGSKDYSRFTGRAKERYAPRSTDGIAGGPLARFQLQKGDPKKK